MDPTDHARPVRQPRHSPATRPARHGCARPARRRSWPARSANKHCRSRISAATRSDVACLAAAASSPMMPAAIVDHPLVFRCGTISAVSTLANANVQAKADSFGGGEVREAARQRLQSIENLEFPDEGLRALNFQGGSYLDAQNQSRPMVEMTRDGFTFLVMGFTGSKAEALASYAKQADDDTLLKLARRIQGRAVKCAGILLKTFDGRGGDRTKSGDTPTSAAPSQRKAGELRRQEEKNKGGRPGQNSDPRGGRVSSNAERRQQLGITRKQDEQWQALAAVPEAQFEALAELTRRLRSRRPPGAGSRRIGCRSRPAGAVRSADLASLKTMASAVWRDRQPLVLCPFQAEPSCWPWVGLSELSRSRMMPSGGRRTCTRSIQVPDRSVSAARFVSLVSRSVSKRPI